MKEDESDNIYFSRNFALNKTTGEVWNKSIGKSLPYDLDTKILIYEDRHNSWFFGVGEYLAKNNEAGFTLLMICAAYLESNHQFRTGVSSIDNSQNCLDEALCRVFPSLTQTQRENFIDGVRNGLFHSGLIKRGVLVSHIPEKVFTENNGELIVNPFRLFEAMKKDCKDYVRKLKEDSVLRVKFETFWDSSGGFYTRGDI